MISNKTTLSLICGSLLTTGLAVILTSPATIPLAAGQSEASAPSTPDAPSAVDAAAERVGVDTATDSEEGIYGALVGSRFDYAFASERHFTLTAEGHTSDEVRFAGDGRLRVTIVARRAEEVLVELCCEELELGGHAGQDEGRDLRTLQAEIAAAPFLLRMATDGRHLGLRFAGEHGLEARQWLRNLVSGLQFVVGEPAGTSWEAEQEELGGTTKARYTWDRQPAYPEAGQLRRELLAAVRIQGAPENVSASVEGNYIASLGGDLHWFGGGEGSERWVVTLPDSEITVRSGRRAAFELLDHDQVHVPSEPSWEGPWHALDGATDGAALARRNEEDRLRQRLAGLTVQEAARRVMQAAEGGQDALDELTDAREKLTMLLRLRPGKLREVRDLVLGADPDSRSAIELLAALGAVETPAAEGVLCTLLADGAQPESLRMHTAVAMFQLSQASAAALETSSRLFVEAAGDGDLRRTTLLLIGRFGDGSPAAVAELRRLEPVAQRDGLLTTWLEALGNARTDQAVALAQPYLGSEEVEVRLAAIHALESVPTDAATGALAGRLPVETDSYVRRVLEAVLANRPQSAASTSSSR